jgi:hypothetical protein
VIGRRFAQQPQAAPTQQDAKAATNRATEPRSKRFDLPREE